MTVSDIISGNTAPARLLINDYEGPTNSYRWTNDQLLVFFNLCTPVIVSARPDALYAADGSLLSIAELLIGGTVQLADKWKPAYVHYIVARAFEMPGQERQNLDAAAHHQNVFNGLVNSL